MLEAAGSHQWWSNFACACGLTDGKAVLGPAKDVLGAWLSNEPRSEQEDLLWRSVLGLNSNRDILWTSALYCFAGESRQDERSAVNFLAVVAAVLDLSQRLLDIAGRLLAADHETDCAGWIRGDGSVGIFGDWEQALHGGKDRGDEGKMEPNALSLGGDVSTFS